MTDGMKSGTGSDPFANDKGDDDASEVEQETANQGTDESSDSGTKSQADTEPSSTTDSQDTERSEDELPYIFARNTVKSDRKETQYFLRGETQTIEKDAYSSVEKELGTDVSLIDVREALVRVGAEHLDEVADELRDWGYRFRED